MHGRMDFTPLSVGCPVIIGDGLKGTDDIEVPVQGVRVHRESEDRTCRDGCGCIYQSDAF